MFELQWRTEGFLVVENAFAAVQLHPSVDVRASLVSSFTSRNWNFENTFVVFALGV